MSTKRLLLYTHTAPVLFCASGNTVIGALLPSLTSVSYLANALTKLHFTIESCNSSKVVVPENP